MCMVIKHIREEENQMKKIITVLALMIVLAGAAFAANNDTLYITAKVKAIDPIYLIYGGKTAEVGNSIVGDNAQAPNGTNTVALDFDPSVKDATGVVYVKLVQRDLAKTTKNVNLTITASALANTQGADAANGLANLTGYKTAVPTAAVVSTAEVTGINHTTTPTASANTVTYQMKYTGTNVGASTVIGVTSFTWNADETLPVGNYQATIQLGYTVQ